MKILKYWLLVLLAGAGGVALWLVYLIVMVFIVK